MRNLAVACALFSMGAAHAQFGRGVGDFSTAGADAQRSSWVRSDAKISRDSLQKPGFQLVWKIKLNNQAMQLNALTPASLLTGYIGYRGFRSLAFVGGSADKVFAMDTDLGRLEWQKPLLNTAAQPGAGATCPGGMTANVTRPVSAAFPQAGGGGGRGGRGAAAKSGVGEPGEGAVTLKEIAARAGAPATPPPADAAGRRGGAAGRGAADAAGRGPRRMPNYLHAVSSDGILHSLYVSNGDEPEPAIKFLPPNANASGLIVVDNVAYAATTGNCGAAPDAVWALDIASKEVATWQAPGGGIAGSEGPAIGPDGILYVATAAGELVALEPKTLKVKDIHKAGSGFTSSPVIFQYKDKTMIAAAAKDGRIHVVDAAALGGSGFQSPSNASSGALASWQDAAGNRFILAATPTAVVALKMVEHNGAPALESAWTSRDLLSPLTPLVVNGVVFAASGGDRGTPAVLYALDGSTGKEMWNSGKTITTFAHGGGISGGGTQIYLGAHDGTFYAFGFPIEH